MLSPLAILNIQALLAFIALAGAIKTGDSWLGASYWTCTDWSDSTCLAAIDSNLAKIAAQLQKLQANVGNLQTSLKATVQSPGYSNISEWVSETDAAVALYQQIIIQDRDEVIAFRDQLNSTAAQIGETLANTLAAMQGHWIGLTGDTRDALGNVLGSFREQLSFVNQHMKDLANQFNASNQVTVDNFLTSLASNYSSPAALIQNTLTAIATNVAAVNSAINSLLSSVATTASGFNDLVSYAQNKASTLATTQFPVDVDANAAQLLAVFKSNVITPNSAAVTAGYQSAIDSLRNELVSLAANDTVNEQQLRLAFSTNVTNILNAASLLAQLPLQAFSGMETTQAIAEGQLRKTEAAFDTALTTALNTAQSIAGNTQSSALATEAQFTTVYQQISNLLTGGSDTISGKMQGMLAGLEMDVGEQLLSSANSLGTYGPSPDLIRAAADADTLSQLMNATQPNALQQLNDVSAAAQLSNQTINATQTLLANTLSANQQSLNNTMRTSLEKIGIALNASVTQLERLLNSSADANAAVLKDEADSLNGAVLALNISSMEASEALVETLTKLNSSIDDEFKQIRDADIVQTGVIGNALRVASTVTTDMTTLLNNTNTIANTTKVDVDDALGLLISGTKKAQGDFDLDASNSLQSLETLSSVSASAVQTSLNSQLTALQNLLASVVLTGTQASGRITPLVSQLNASTIALLAKQASWLKNMSDAATNVTTNAQSIPSAFEQYIKTAISNLRASSASAILNASNDATVDINSQVATFNSTVVVPAMQTLRTALDNDASTVASAQLSINNLTSVVSAIQRMNDRFTKASEGKFDALVADYRKAVSDHKILNGTVADDIISRFGAEQALIRSDANVISQLETGVSAFSSQAVAGLAGNLTAIVDESAAVMTGIHNSIEEMGQSTVEISAADQAAEEDSVSQVTLALGKLSSDVSGALEETIDHFVSSDSQIRSMANQLSSALVDASIPGFQLTADFSDDATATGLKTAAAVDSLAGLINDHSAAVKSVNDAGQQSIAVTAGAAADALDTAVTAISDSASTLSNSAAESSATALSQLSATAGSFGEATASLAQVNSANDEMIHSILSAVSEREAALAAYMAGNASATGNVAAALQVLIDSWGELSTLALQSTQNATEDLSRQASELQSTLDANLADSADTATTGISGPTDAVSQDLVAIQNLAKQNLPVEDALIGGIRDSLNDEAATMESMKGLETSATNKFLSFRSDKSASNSVSTKLSQWFARFQTALNKDITTMQR